MEDNRLERVEKSVRIWDTVIVTLLISLKLVNYTLVQYLSSPSGGYFSALFGIIYTCFFLYRLYFYLIKLRRRSIRINPLAICIFIILLFWYFLTKHSDTSWIQFICYALLPFVVCSVARPDSRLLLIFTMTVGLISLPVSGKLLVVGYYNSFNMDICYAYLPCIVAAIAYFFSYRQDRNLFANTLCLISCYYLFLLLMNGMRGTLMCIGIAFLLMLYMGPNRRKMTLFKAIIILVAIIILFNFDNLVVAFNAYFSSKGINVYFLNKLIRLSTDITNGRLNLWAETFEGFREAPIFGRGVNTFSYYTSFSYPHNFFLQFLFEGGLFALTWLVILMIFGSRKVLTTKNNNEELVNYIFVFSVSVPYLLVSANIWLTPLLWVYIGFLIRYCHYSTSADR